MFDPSLHLPVSLAMFQDIFHAPSGSEILRIILRWSHFVAGITWIGLLYFFNLVNVNFMKALDAPTKKVVIPALMPKALWYFRWGAVVTYAALFFLYRVPALTKDGRILAVAVAVLMVVMTCLVLYVLGTKSNNCDSTGNCVYLGNKTLSIGVGGGLGILMLLNVWGIIWPAQKRIIAGTVSGEAAPPALARAAFLASRTNAWLSLPMLFLMAQSHDYAFFAGK